MKLIFWLVPACLLVWWLAKRNGSAPTSQTARQTTAATTTATAVTPDPFWNGWNTQTDQILKQTTAAVGAAQAATNVIGQAIGWFSKPTLAQGPSSEPTSNGSGAGVPEGEDWYIQN